MVMGTSSNSMKPGLHRLRELERIFSGCSLAEIIKIEHPKK
jgi:hypothetical protein